MTDHTLAQCLLAGAVTGGDGFAPDTIIASDGEIADLPKINLVRHGKVSGPLSGCRFTFSASARGAYNIQVGPVAARIDVGANTRCAVDLRLWRDPCLTIGAGTTINQARFIIDNAEVEIGEDCLFSDQITVQSSDQHGLIDLKTMEITNTEARKITFGDHVWIGRHAMIMPGVTLGAGTVVGAGAIVTGSFGPCCYLVGVPARCVREAASWTRLPTGASEGELAFFQRLKAAMPGP